MLDDDSMLLVLALSCVVCGRYLDRHMMDMDDSSCLLHMI